MERYDIVVQSLDPGADPARASSALVDALGLAPDEARSALAALPRTVAYDCDEVAAESALAALRAHGLGVRLVRPSSSWSIAADPPPLRASLPELDEDEPRYVLPALRPVVLERAPAPREPAPPDEPPRASARPPSAHDDPSGPVELVPDERDSMPLGELLQHASSSRAARAAPRRTPPFSSATRAALWAVWSGGLAWSGQALGIAFVGAILYVWARLGACAAGATDGVLLVALAGLVTSAMALGLARVWFQAAFRSGLGERARCEPEPLGTHVLVGYLLAGVAPMLLVGTVAGLATAGWLASNPWARSLPQGDALRHLGGLARHVGVVLALLVLHAPIGLTLAELRGRALAYLDLRRAWALVRGAPRELAGAWGAWAVTALVARAWIAGWLAVSPAPDGWRIALAVVPAVLALALGWSTTGALMGALARSMPSARR